MAVRGDFSSIQRFKASLRGLPASLAHNVAQKVSPAMTLLTQGAFSSGRTVYAEPRPVSTVGRPLSLVKTGATQGSLRFTTQGRIVRAVLGTRYAKYLIGKYKILPNGGLPVAWSQRLVDLARQAFTEASR